MTTLERALNSIGKRCFVEYFYSFQNCTDEAALAQKLLDENQNASSLRAQMTRIHYAAWIFKEKLEEDALKMVKNSSRMDEVTHSRATAILLEISK